MKTIHTYFLILLLSPLFFQSCKKENDLPRRHTVLMAEVKDPYTAVPLPHDTLRIVEHYSNGATVASGPYIADVNGQFSISYDMNSTGKADFYNFYFSHPNMPSAYVGLYPQDMDKETVHLPVIVNTNTHLNIDFIDNPGGNPDNEAYDISLEWPDHSSYTVFAHHPALTNNNGGVNIPASYYGWSQAILHYTLRVEGITTMHSDTIPALGTTPGTVHRIIHY